MYARICARALSFSNERIGDCGATRIAIVFRGVVLGPGFTTTGAGLGAFTLKQEEERVRH